MDTTDANLALLSLNLGFDAPLYQFGGGEQSLGVSLNVAGGLMGTTRSDVNGLNAQLGLTQGGVAMPGKADFEVAGAENLTMAADGPGIWFGRWRGRAGATKPTPGSSK